ncbi:MAG: TraU family protein [Emcibacter sp.]|nr:TraU family protein [Emcibacter sp.]
MTTGYTLTSLPNCADNQDHFIQPVNPVPATSGPNTCVPMGRSNVLFESGRMIPVIGEDFGYLIWRKRNCCVM